MKSFLIITILSVCSVFSQNPSVTYNKSSRGTLPTNLNVMASSVTAASITNTVATASTMAGYDASKKLVTRQVVNADVAAAAAIDATKIANGAVSNTEFQLLDGKTALGNVSNSGTPVNLAFPVYNGTSGIAIQPSNITGSADGDDMNIPGVLSLTGTSQGSIYLGDSDNSAGHRRTANPTITTEINEIGPPAPFSGIPFYVLTAVTNMEPRQAVSGVDYFAVVTTTQGQLIRRGAAVDEPFAANTFGDIVVGDGTDVISRSSKNFVRFFDDFLSEEVASVHGETRWAEIVVATGTVVVSAGEPGEPGTTTFTISTSSGSSATLYKKETGLTFGDGRRVWECKLKLTTLSDATDTYIVRLGFVDSTSAPVDGVYFEYTHATNAGNWLCTTIQNTINITTNQTSIPPVAGTWQTFKIDVNAAGSAAVFSIDGATVQTNSANIPVGAARLTGERISILRTAGTSNARVMTLGFVDSLWKPTTLR